MLIQAQNLDELPEETAELEGEYDEGDDEGEDVEVARDQLTGQQNSYEMITWEQEDILYYQE